MRSRYPKRRLGPADKSIPRKATCCWSIPAKAAATSGVSPYVVTSSDFQHYVSKLVNIDGKYYDLKISPAGDKLTLTANSQATGNITNPNAHFNFVIYSDDCVLKLSGEKDKPIALPVGQWKLLSYTIDVPEHPEDAEQAGREKRGCENGFWNAGSSPALEGILGAGAAPMAPSRLRPSMVTATATMDYKPVDVREGETVELPFGPPYKPVVKIDYMQPDGPNGQKQAQLGMTLVGSVGEVCTNMIAGGSRPGKPEFTIKDPKGKEVETGSFEYG